MAFTITYVFTDGKTETSTTEVNLPDATAYADVEIFATQFAGLLKPLISGELSSATISNPVSVGAIIPALLDADVEEGARFQFRTAGGFYTSMRIPTFLESLIQPNGRQVDQTDVDVSAYLTAMTSGLDLIGAGGSGTIQPSDKRDDDITTVEQAREQFLSSRRAR